MGIAIANKISNGIMQALIIGENIRESNNTFDSPV
jgi:hypothetical protein